MNWPLNVNNFNFLDRLNIAFFILNKKNRWTQDKQVKKFEEKMATFMDSKYAVFCSSGSTANTMIAMMLRDQAPSKNSIIFPSTTWTTSVAPFVREGFIPKFIDVNLEDLCIDYSKLEETLKQNDDILCIFATSLLGFVPDIEKLQQLADKYSVKLMLDNCENTFGKFKNKNISSYTTSSTSTYFGHQLQSIEGGFVFTSSEQEYEYLQMLRNHGMTRSLENPLKYNNPNVDNRFDFYCLGSNFRNTDFNAFVGLIDLSKANAYIEKRKQIYTHFSSSLNSNYLLPKEYADRESVAFSLPIIFNNEKNKIKALKFCLEQGIETRPIISGNLLRQTCYKQFASYEEFPNSEFLHKCGFYIGLHNKLKFSQVDKVVKYLNNL